MNNKLLTIFLTVFLDLVGFGLIIPLSPYLARTFEADPLQIGFLMATYSGLQFIFSPIWGRLSDRIGRRPVIILCLIGTGVGHLAFAFASHLAMLYLARAVAGLFSGNISTAMAYVADVTTEKDRAKGMGLMGAAFGLGFILGPVLGAGFALLGGYLEGQFFAGPPFGPQFSAVAAGLLCLGTAAFAWRALPESLSTELRAQSGLKRVGRFNAFKKVIKTPVRGQMVAGLALTVLAMGLIENQLFLFVDDKFSWGLVQASLGFAYVGVIMALTQGILIRRVLSKFGERRTVMAGLTLSLIAFAMMATAHQVWWLAIAVTFLGFGVGFSNPSFNGVISVLSGKSEQGEVMGVTHGLGALARVIGPLVGGWSYKHLGIHSPFAISFVLVALAIVLVLSVLKMVPRSSLDEAVRLKK